jgi:SAM-dependent methyltransferase
VAVGGGALGTIPTTHPQLEELIRWCIGLDYISESCKDGIQTGNHYQSIQLGDEKTSGFRTDRSQFLDLINFRSMKVLDLGSNLGELSRAVRARGADLVDGFEYDPFFIEVAQLLNAYNSTTRVSFFERDITDEMSYRGQYDIVMAFAVWSYMAPMLSAIDRITDILLLETHNLDGNLQRDYIDPLSRFFPHSVVLGESDWGKTQDPSGRRAVVVCARTRERLERVMNLANP